MQKTARLTVTYARAMKFIARLEYEYTQVAVDLFCENITLEHCLLVVCDHVFPFLLYLKECVIILGYGTMVS